MEKYPQLGPETKPQLIIMSSDLLMEYEQLWALQIYWRSWFPKGKHVC